MYVNSAGLNPALFLRLLARHRMSVLLPIATREPYGTITGR